jgi:class 3 adenylate cyclase
VNGTLYEFLLPEEQGQTDSERVLRHVVLKADVRDSTRLTRTMMEKGTESGVLLQPELL